MLDCQHAQIAYAGSDEEMLPKSRQGMIADDAAENDERHE
jgi:hypothetical protein